MYLLYILFGQPQRYRNCENRITFTFRPTVHYFHICSLCQYVYFSYMFSPLSCILVSYHANISMYFSKVVLFMACDGYAIIGRLHPWIRRPLHRFWCPILDAGAQCIDLGQNIYAKTYMGPKTYIGILTDVYLVVTRWLAMPMVS